MPFDTPLSPNDEIGFQQWKQQYAPNDSGGDYDLRGAFKAGLTPDPVSGHWPDTYKKPNHETFSDESIYSSLVGTKPGTWQANTEYIPFAAKDKPLNMQVPMLQELPGIISRESRMRALQNSGGNFGAVTQRALQTGPFKAASDRQSSWLPKSAPVQVAFGNVNEADSLRPANMGRPAVPADTQVIAQPNVQTPAGSGYKPNEVDRIRAEQEATDKANAAAADLLTRQKNARAVGLPIPKK